MVEILTGSEKLCYNPTRVIESSKYKGKSFDLERMNNHSFILGKEFPIMSEKEQGSVKWFNGSKGYGFIERDSGGDIFVHFSAILSEGYRTLEEGQRVEFTVAQGPKGLQAQEVVVIS